MKYCSFYLLFIFCFVLFWSDYTHCCWLGSHTVFGFWVPNDEKDALRNVTGSTGLYHSANIKWKQQNHILGDISEYLPLYCLFLFLKLWFPFTLMWWIGGLLKTQFKHYQIISLMDNIRRISFSFIHDEGDDCLNQMYLRMSLSPNDCFLSACWFWKAIYIIFLFHFPHHVH